MSVRARLLTSVLAVVLSAGLFATAIAQVPDPDAVGVYFDTAYFENEAVNQVVPHTATAYLVLKNPTETVGGLGGWECRVEHEGYAPLTQWNLAGNGMNFKTPPDFIVAMIDPLPIVGGQVLLASFDMLVAEATPFQIELVPLRHAPSIPDAMSYIPFDDKEALTPMAPITGQPAVATYNWVPYCSVDGTRLLFGEVPLETNIYRFIDVTNVGGGTLMVTPQISGVGFFLDGPATVSVLSGSTETIRVVFNAPAPGTFFGSLDLGTACGTVELIGTGRPPEVSYYFDPVGLDFGNLITGTVRTENIRFFNTGETTFELTPATSCPEYRVLPDGVVVVPPGTSRTFNVTFAPQTTGLYQCEVSFGPGITPVALNGTAHEPNDLITLVPASLDFGAQLGGHTRELTVRMINGGAATLTAVGMLEGAGAPFSMVDPVSGQTVSLPGGSYRDFVVAFHPTMEGVFTNQLMFPDLGLVVPLSGIGVIPLGTVVADPAAIDFPETYVGNSVSRTLFYRNYTGADVDLVPTLTPEAPHFRIIAGEFPVTVPDGGSHLVTVSYNPQTTGPHNAVLSAGSVAPDVPLTGTGRISTSGITISPSYLEFGLWPVDGAGEMEVRVINNGWTAVDMNVWIEPADGPFSLSAGAGTGVVPPNSTAILKVRFAPTAAGPYSGWLHLGPLLTSVPLTGQAGDDVPLCGLSATTMVFPDTPTGSGASRLLTVNNGGNGDLIIDPTVSCSSFMTVTGADTLAPGESTSVAILFQPISVGTHECILDLGDNMCGNIILHGEAFDGGPVGNSEDVVGVYFDQEFTQHNISDLVDHIPFTAYLVLKQPSLPADITAWELRMVVPDGAFMLNSELRGGGINFMAPPDFLVGLQTPHPATEDVHLATFSMFSVSLSQNAPLALTPIRVPSLPDAMAVASGPNHELRPIFPVGGLPVVSLLNYDSPVAVTRMSAVVTEAGVELAWPVPNQAGSTSALWRHGPGGVVDLLTEEPVLGRGQLTWTDRTGSFAPGTTLGYSYSIRSGGTEVYRSPVTEVTLPGAAVMATRLLPNVPNPFNPETAVHFELARAGRVRISVYDVAGRRIAQLLNEHREAGADNVVWRGRDDRGRTVTSGAYYIRLEADGNVDTRKVMLLK